MNRRPYEGINNYLQFQNSSTRRTAMNILEKLMKILEKSRKELLLSEEDKKIIKEISQCNNSYYRMRILDILKYELEDWSIMVS